VDKLADAGMGSTSGSCAIIRFHYSTTEGVAMAREGYYYWPMAHRSRRRWWSTWPAPIPTSSTAWPASKTP
jgi:hypothetical protein